MTSEIKYYNGLTDEFPADKLKFAEIADEFLAFIGDAPLVMHSAAFNLEFVNSELHRIGRAPIPYILLDGIRALEEG